MVEKCYLETQKSVLGRCVSYYCFGIFLRLRDCRATVLKHDFCFLNEALLSRFSFNTDINEIHVK